MLVSYMASFDYWKLPISEICVEKTQIIIRNSKCINLESDIVFRYRSFLF